MMFAPAPTFHRLRYLKIDPDLVLPKVRADIENQCTLIAEGKARIEDVVTHALDIFEKVRVVWLWLWVCVCVDGVGLQKRW